MARQIRDPLVRFVALCRETPEGCLEWIGRRQTHSLHPERGGYPVFRVKSDGQWITVYAHRWILEQELGRPIQDGCEADHCVCHNRSCVRPSHLRELLKADNIREANARRYARA